MPRGQALGMVSQLPEGDQTSVTRKQLLARLDVCMGGRVAEVSNFFLCIYVSFYIYFEKTN
jgi:ATP-dependent Zn protease